MKIDNSNKRVALQCATFAAIFGLMAFFMDMMEETEEQTTYSITLENLIHAQSETNGETGGGGADGEADGDDTDGETGGGTGGGGTTGGGCTCENNPGTYYKGYHNHTKIIRNFSGSISSYMRRNFILPAGLSITVGASGSLTYCRRSFILFFLGKVLQKSKWMYTF